MGVIQTSKKISLGKFMKKKKNKEIREATSQKITMILPVCNQETSIGSLVLLSKLYVNNVIVIDNSSVDRTAEIAKKAGAEVIVHETGKGKCEALKTGFKASVDLGADIIVIMDSEGQHNPIDIPMLVAPIIEGDAEMVNGSRYLNGLGKHTLIYHRVGQTLQETTAQTNPDLKITDPQNGFRAFAASTIDIFSFRAQDVAIESEMLEDARKAGISIKEVEIGVLRDYEEPGKNPVQSIRGLLTTIADDIETNTSLYYNSVPGFALATCGLYMGFKFLESFFTGMDSLNFGPAFLMIFLAVFGMYLTFRGIVMHSIVRVIRQAESVQ
jgi:glycosyltransferase involved in cell wall biosynthesis